MDAFYAAPPVSRTITAAIVVTSALVHFLELIAIDKLVFVREWVFALPPGLWRVFTAFLVTKPGLSVVMDPYFVYMLSSMLETGVPKFAAKADLVVYLAFVAGVIVSTSGVFLGGFLFLEALTVALCHTAAQHNPRSKINFFLFRVDMMWAPYVMLGMTFVMAGKTPAIQQATGIFASHLYDFLTRIWPDFGGPHARNYLTAPAFVTRLFEEPNAPRTTQTRAYGSAFPAVRTPAAQNQSTPQSGSSWTSGSSWGSRGQGRRLGGD